MPVDHWAGFVEALDAEIAAEQAAAKTYRGGKTWDGRYWHTWWGSSDQFAKEIRDHHPRLHVDEAATVPLDGRVGWRPEDEAAPEPSAPCPKCAGRIGRGSNLYCPRCGLSGHEDRLAGQRRLAGPVPGPDPDETPTPAPPTQRRPGEPPDAEEPRRPTRRERRAAMFGRAAETPGVPS